MAQKTDSETAAGQDEAARRGAGTDLLGVVALTSPMLAVLELACSRRIPGRLTGPRWESDSAELQDMIEDLAPQLGQLGTELAKAAAAVVKATPKDGDRKRPGPTPADATAKPPVSAEPGRKQS